MAFQEKKITYELKLILGNFKPTGTSLRKPKHKQGGEKTNIALNAAACDVAPTEGNGLRL